MDALIEQLTSDFDLVLVAFLALGLVVGLVELAWELVSGKMTWRRLQEVLASLSVQIPSTLLEKASGAMTLFVFFAAWQLVPWKLELGWGALAAAVLGVDFIHYWTHRWEHEIRDLRGARDWDEIRGYVLGPPGWRPAREGGAS